MKNQMSEVQEFLHLRRIAMVGVSRNPRDFSRALWNELRTRGFDMVAVNPAADDIDGQPCFPYVAGIEPEVDGVLVMTKPAETPAILEECAARGVRYAWLYRGVGKGAVDEWAAEKARGLGITVIAGECPFMFLREAGFPHHLHGWFRRLTGGYPN
ncbi:MAG: CoA-binding protein [Bryobacteraceae bacterium]